MINNDKTKIKQTKKIKFMSKTMTRKKMYVKVTNRIEICIGSLICN